MLAHLKALTISLAIALFLAANSQAEAQHEKKAAAGGHIMIVPAEIKLTDGPPGLPAGAKVFALEGDPAKKGSFTLRLMFPANYKIPPHWHPADEHVTVLSGKLYMGMGDKLDSANSTALPPGGFGMMPAKSHHYAWTSEETTIQLHGIGPWGITYVNPADDPRKKSSR